ncbi:PEP-CTERM sorting domain-containing protein [Pantanalinema sp. GBBB05]|uniref:PEP-CTERM sorting domain-containing protein n=1 Tax=Pantanalinema sp. GBBB05 TaxID=2604139 RepID=UPI001DF19686|nr:PEP-CTERM sorting domain-containing protein [Pantanalinema sp. GBBB05]
MTTSIVRGLKCLSLAAMALMLLEACNRPASAFSLVQSTVSLDPRITVQADEWLPCFGIRGCYQPSPATPEDLPASLSNAILEDVAQRSGQPLANLQIIDVSRVTWIDGCMGAYQPDIMCTFALVEGWAVVVGSDRQQWLYSAGNSNRFAYIGPYDGETTQPGSSQDYPILPEAIKSGEWVFWNAPSGKWFDPPITPGFRYQMLSNSLFNSLGLPIGIDGDDLFTISVGNLVLGQFNSHQSIDFVSLLGTGVSEFTITAINPLVSAQDPAAFPVRLAFDTATADFSMTAIEDNSAAVPEPSSILGLLLAGITGTKLKRRVCPNQTTDS